MKEQRAIQKQKELEAYMKEDAARMRARQKARKELLEQERREGERLLAEEMAKVAAPWPATRIRRASWYEDKGK